MMLQERVSTDMPCANSDNPCLRLNTHMASSRLNKKTAVLDLVRSVARSYQDCSLITIRASLMIPWDLLDNFIRICTIRSGPLRNWSDISCVTTMSSIQEVFPWLVRHADWLVARYLLHLEILTSHYRCGKKLHDITLWTCRSITKQRSRKVGWQTVIHVKVRTLVWARDSCSRNHCYSTVNDQTCQKNQKIVWNTPRSLNGNIVFS